MIAERYERVFLVVSGAVLVVFLAALVWASVGMGIHLPGRAGEIDPATVGETPPFDEPGVREVSPGVYEVVVIGRAWLFQPREIRVPAGAEVRIVATSADVVHGFSVEGTRVNMMLVPGQISEITTRFREPGEHLLICHEYCGMAHHRMFGKVIVE